MAHRHGQVLVFGALVAVAIGLNVIDQFTFAVAVPAEDFGWLVLDSVVGVAFAICAAVARGLGHSRAAWLMLSGSVLWMTGNLTPALQLVSPWWVVPYSLQNGTELMVVILAVGYPTGRATSAFGRVVTLCASVVYAAEVATRLVLLGLVGTDPEDLKLLHPAWNAVICVAVVALVMIRWMRGSAPWRAVNLLVTVSTIGLGGIWLWFDVLAIAGRQADGPGPAYLSNAALAAFPIMYVVGLHALRQTRARVADVILAARDGIDRSEWDRLVRQSLNDRDARVLWKHPSTDHFVDSRGRDIGAAPPGSFAVISRGHQIAALVHDSASGAKRDLLESLGESLRLTTENERLARELERSLVQVRESRERMVGATDEARRRIERDLHDGAQQLLLTAALTVENARRRALDGNDPELVQTLATATTYLAMARRELRELAHGLTPAVLDHGGLEGALEELALRCPVPTTVDVCGGRRPEGVTEVTVFFMVAECLTNIATHSDADAAAVRVTTEDGVCVTVADNGRGGASIGPGGGLAGLIDRVEAVGGTLTVASPPGHGTTVTATIPSRVGAPG